MLVGFKEVITECSVRALKNLFAFFKGKKVLGLNGLFCFLFPGVQELDPAFPPAFADVDLGSNSLA